jgi:hypothetical protein
MKAIQRRKDPRQRLGTSQKKSVVTISLRVSIEEYNKIVDVCKEKDITMSEYIRTNVVPSYSTVTDVV